MEYQLKEELVSLLDTIRNLDIFKMGEVIPNQLKNKIEAILSSDKKIVTRPQSVGFKDQVVSYSTEDKRLALRALRKFKLHPV